MDYDELYAELSASRRRNKELQARIAELKTIKPCVPCKTCKPLEAECERLKKENAELREEFTIEIAHNESLQLKLAEQEGRNEFLRGACELLRTERDHTKGSNTVLRVANRDLKNALDDMLLQVDGRDKQIATLQTLNGKLLGHAVEARKGSTIK